MPTARVPLETSNEFKRVLELASLVESATDAVIGVTPEGVITSWGESAELLFGYTREEAVGRPITMLAPLDRSDEPTTFIEHVLSGQRVQRVETERICRDGRSVNVLLSLAAIRYDDGVMRYAAHRHREPESRLADYLAEARTMLGMAPGAPRPARPWSANDPASGLVGSLDVGPDFEALRWFWLPEEMAAEA